MPRVSSSAACAFRGETQRLGVPDMPVMSPELRAWIEARRATILEATWERLSIADEQNEQADYEARPAPSKVYFRGKVVSI